MGCPPPENEPLIMGTSDNPGTVACVFPKCLSSFLCFLCHVIQHGGISGKFLYAGLSVQFGIQSGFDHTKSERAVLHHLFCPCHGFVFQAVERNDCIDQSHFQCFLCGVLTAKEPYFTGFLLPYDACQIGRAESGVEAAYLGTCLSEMAFSEAMVRSHTTCST